jgi:RNA polymerase sigma-70 factor (ECF subfamily)
LVRICNRLTSQGEPGPETAPDHGSADHACPHAADHALAGEAVAGSHAARKQFAERMRCVPKYLAVMNLRCGRPFTDHELEDLMQETLVELWRRLDSYAGLASLQTWAWRFCQQVFSSRLRSARRRPPSVAIDETRSQGAPAQGSLDYEYVYLAIDRLDPRDASIVRLRHFDQLSYGEIGKRMALPESSTKAAYHRALARLRELLHPLQREAGL